MSVARHTLYNLLGSIVPMCLSLLTVPIYLSLIGAAQYGILAIVWLFLGYFGVFDPGLSRATAYNIAQLANEPTIKRQEVFWTAISINTAFGVLGGILVYLIARPIFEHWFKMPEMIRGQVMSSIPWLAVAIPVGTMAGVFSGALEGLRRFALVNTINIAGTLAFQICPICIAFFFPNRLSLIIAATVLLRFFTSAVFFGFSWFYCQAGRPRLASFTVARLLLSYGSWITASNLIVPFLASFDKILIGSYLGVVDVTIYTIPDNLTRRMTIIPGALTRSLFPTIAADQSTDSTNVLQRSFLTLLAILVPLTVFGILFFHLFLSIWLGSDIADHSSIIGIILLLGIFFNSLAYLPAMYLQATGRPNLNAIFHLIEVIPHIFFLSLGIYYLKLQGIALAVLFISVLDTLLLFWATGMQIWRMRQFQTGLLFIIIALVMFCILPWYRWESYILFGFLSIVCSIYFCIVVPELVERAKMMLPSKARFWRI